MFDHLNEIIAASQRRPVVEVAGECDRVFIDAAFDLDRNEQGGELFVRILNSTGITPAVYSNAMIAAIDYATEHKECKSLVVCKDFYLIVKWGPALDMALKIYDAMRLCKVK